MSEPSSEMLTWNMEQNPVEAREQESLVLFKSFLKDTLSEIKWNLSEIM